MSYIYKLRFCLLVVLFSQISFAQIGNVIARKQPKQSTHKEQSKTSILNSQIQQLTNNLTHHLKTDEEKSKAIFYWIATNIHYDTALQIDKTLQRKIYKNENKVIEQVLIRKKALCGGYAFLFQRMCRSIMIESQVIHGFTKISGVVRKSDKVHHTWNAVKINGQWELLDITWARSHSLDSNPNEFWFATSPNNFINSHLPENPRWTLLNKRISLAEFDLP